MTTGWQGILNDGEEILWQGRPDTAPVLTPSAFGKLIFGLFFSGFAVFWMIGAASTGGIFWMFGLIHFFAGVGVMGSGVFWPGIKARYTWYSLSNQRAFIATDFPWATRRLKSFPITAGTSLSLEEGKLDTVLFASEDYRVKGRTRTHRIGFQRIRDGRAVYNMMRDIQRADRQESHA
ncbi:aspartate carbamoyltransferase catalytic subunit [Thalassovita sp.]|jgi:hypothetical protein|uniref:aspartate carbamoyltransferase catalytic subunit n=1 Tax=Thalassovita sp. TaxID=1979401 RepID=UPI003B5BBD5A